MYKTTDSEVPREREVAWVSGVIIKRQQGHDKTTRLGPARRTINPSVEGCQTKYQAVFFALLSVGATPGGKEPDGSGDDSVEDGAASYGVWKHGVPVFWWSVGGDDGGTLSQSFIGYGVQELRLLLGVGSKAEVV